MLSRSNTIHQSNLFGTDFLLQLDANDRLLKLADTIPWRGFDEAYSIHYTKWIGAQGMERIFRMSVGLHGESALEDVVHVDTTVQEKNITYPTVSQTSDQDCPIPWYFTAAQFR